MRKIGLALWILLICSSLAAQAAESLAEHSDRPASSVLVDPHWLATKLQQPGVRLVEIGERESYEKGHLPEATFVDWIKDLTDPALPERYNLLSRQQMEQLLSRLGISKETTIVLYDKLENRLATRMLWSLRYYGHERAKILDGGGNAWLRAQLPIVIDIPSITHTEYRVAKVNPDLAASREFITQRLGQSECVLIDGRPVGQYTGELPGKVFHTGKEHARRGHLPEAINIPWRDNLNEDGTFKSVSELRKLYSGHGFDKSKSIVTYCNEGLHAAHPWFVLTELLGYRNVRLYDDSLSEWANMTKQPLELAVKR